MKLIYLIKHNLKRIMKNKVSIALTFILPTVVIFSMGFITNRYSDSSRSYYVVNSDAGIYGREFIGELSKDFKVKVLPREDALEKLKKKTISEFYELGRDFSKEVENGQKPQLIVNRREAIQGFSDFQIKSEELGKRLVFSTLVEKASGEKIELGDTANEEVNIKVSTERKTGMGSQMIINFLISFNLFCAIGMCSELFTLKSERTLRRALTTANTPKTIIGAILGAQFIVVFLGYAALLLIYAIINDKALLVQAPIIIINLMMITGVTLSLAVFVSRILKNEKLIPVILQIILVSTCFIGGSFVPIDMLPEGISLLSKFTPQYWAIKSIAEGRYEFSLIVLLFGILLFTAGTVSTRSFAEV